MNLDLIRYFDFLSTEVKLTINKGDTRLKTVLGGMLSIISVIVTIAFGIYFFVQLLNKESSFVITSTQITPFIKIKNSNEFPFLVRLTNDISAPYDYPDKIYNITLKYWYVQSSEMQQEDSYDIQLEKCDINKHFGQYRSLFEPLTDLDTFYCALLRPDNFTIHGRYGDVNPFGFYHFYISMCWKRKDCYDIDTLKNITENIFLDFRTVDFSIESYKSNPKEETIHSSRHMLSSTIFKRVWLSISGIKYLTDEGFFFSSITSETFSQIDSTRYDSDNRNIFNAEGTFAALTLITTGTNYIHNREYTKIQSYLASIGGIVNFIQVIAFILNYTYSQNSFHFRLINDLIRNTLFQKDLFIDSYNHDYKINSKSATKNLNVLKQNISETNKSKHTLQRLNTMNQRCHLILKKRQKWYYKLIPLKLSLDKESKLLLRIIEGINVYMNISTILAKTEEASLLTKRILATENKKECLTNNLLCPNKKIHFSEKRILKNISLSFLNNNKSDSIIQFLN